MDDDPLRRPIGWWLKHVDGLIDVAFGATLRAQAVSRRQWQILNGLAEGTPAAELLASLTVFGDDEGGVHAALAGLALRGWLLTGPAEELAITSDGRAQHERISAEVRAMRSSVTEGLAAEDYRAVVTGLARMAQNLDRLVADATRAEGGAQGGAEGLGQPPARGSDT